MKKTVKAEIRTTVENTLAEAMQRLKIATPSKKTRKAIARVSKSLRADIMAASRRERKKGAAHAAGTASTREALAVA